MHRTLTTLINRLEDPVLSEAHVIKWGSPVLSFGDLSSSRVASLGINPSNMEFMDTIGNELHVTCRRFHTLNSLGLSSWSVVEARHIRQIIRSYEYYFKRNPYDR